VSSARSAPIAIRRTTQGQSHGLPVFTAVMTAANTAQSVPANIGPGSWNSESINAA
jgi:hypothetical protein